MTHSSPPNEAGLFSANERSDASDRMALSFLLQQIPFFFYFLLLGYFNLRRGCPVNADASAVVGL